MSDDLIERLREDAKNMRAWHADEWADDCEQAAEALTRSSSSSELVEALREAREQLNSCAEMLEHRHVEPLATRAVIRRIDSALSKAISAGGRG